ncbi:MinD/ParA family ATP-binding protein [Paenibacillus sp. FSL L8-0708]|uniref:MinD/ParA family ATP-binding protein n=1 Tax=Paenibacillus sp. FSL L8-0708 TaxID=2975311 RepID=UPI0030F5D3C2
MNDKTLIAVWGSPGSGKTVTAVKLAQAFARRKLNVLLLCSDALCPSAATIAPKGSDNHASLGELLSLPSLNQDDILHYALPLDVSPHIALLGYKKGDTSFSYATYTREHAVDLLTLARHLADVVIVDCSSYLSADLLSIVALEMADHVVRIHSCELKSLMFFASYLPLLTDHRFRRSSVVPVLSKVKPEQDSNEYSQVFGGIDVILPYLVQIEQQVAAAQLLEECSGKEAAAYQQGIHSLLEQLLPTKPTIATPKRTNTPDNSPSYLKKVLSRFSSSKQGDRS